MDGLPVAVAFGSVLALGAHVGGAQPTRLMDLALWGVDLVVSLVGGLVLATFLAGAYRAAAEADTPEPALLGADEPGPGPTP